MKKGFVPALGTPLDKNGNLIEASFAKQIEDQIAAGATGLLCMGSMGIQAYIRQSEYPRVAKAAVDAAKGRVPVFVGAMDCSILRVKDRMEAIEDLNLDAVVLTTPYYNPCSRDQMMNFFLGAAKCTSHNILLYDLAAITQSKITYDMVCELVKKEPKIVGIKTADLQMLRKLRLNPEIPEDFIMVYSGLDTFDIACKWGIPNCLDGMCSCTPYSSKMMFESVEKGDYDSAAKYLSAIVGLRDLFIQCDLWPAYTATMNMLGYEGSFGPDYVSALKEGNLELLRDALLKMGEPV